MAAFSLRASSALALVLVTIDLTSVPYSQDEHDQLLVSDPVDHAVIAHADAIEVVLPLELDRTSGPRFDGKVFDMSDDPFSHGRGKFPELPNGRRRDLDAVPTACIGRHATLNRFTVPSIGYPALLGARGKLYKIIDGVPAQLDNKSRVAIRLIAFNQAFTSMSARKAHDALIGGIVQNAPAQEGDDMIRVTTSKARQEFARVLRKVKEGKRFLLERHDKGVAAIVSVEDLALLEAIENRRDLEDARRALAEVAEQGAIPWEEAKKELGL
jgi:antitoxin (DNA-binding transcriptional repressor) of toxin-antitoxin stability system